MLHYTCHVTLDQCPCQKKALNLLNNKLHNEAQKEEVSSLNREREGNFEDPSQVENQRNENVTTILEQ